MFSQIDRVTYSNDKVQIGDLTATCPQRIQKEIKEYLRKASREKEKWVFALPWIHESLKFDRITLITSKELQPVTFQDIVNSDSILFVDKIMCQFQPPEIKIDINNLEKRLYLIPKETEIQGKVKGEVVFKAPREFSASWSGSKILDQEESMNKMRQLLSGQAMTYWEKYSWKYVTISNKLQYIELRVFNSHSERTIGCIPLTRES